MMNTIQYKSFMLFKITVRHCKSIMMSKYTLFFSFLLPQLTDIAKLPLFHKCSGKGIFSVELATKKDKNIIGPRTKFWHRSEIILPLTAFAMKPLAQIPLHPRFGDQSQSRADREEDGECCSPKAGRDSGRGGRGVELSLQKLSALRWNNIVVSADPRFLAYLEAAAMRCSNLRPAQKCRSPYRRVHLTASGWKRLQNDLRLLAQSDGFKRSVSLHYWLGIRNGLRVFHSALARVIAFQKLVTPARIAHLDHSLIQVAWDPASTKCKLYLTRT